MQAVVELIKKESNQHPSCLYLRLLSLVDYDDDHRLPFLFFAVIPVIKHSLSIFCHSN